MNELLTELVKSSEVAARIARICRQEKELFELLVQEKTGEEKNSNFKRDFKTLADVLIQETVRHVVATKFPKLRDHIRGEESSHFTNSLGQQIEVQVCSTQSQTAALLEVALDGNTPAATLLASAVHLELSDPPLRLAPLPVNLSNLGIWVDPLDGTNEYIKGCDVPPTHNGIHTTGLHCCTILIGVYDITTGLPLAGVVNQPFYKQGASGQWLGRCYWGMSHFRVHISGELHCCGFHRERHSWGEAIDISEKPQQRGGVIVTSGNETADCKQRLTEGGYHVISVKGAGYKQLCVIIGMAVAFVRVGRATFKWDTCAPHAVLVARGGGLAMLRHALHQQELTNEVAVKYVRPDDPSCSGGETWRNTNGLLAYASTAVGQDILRLLHQ